MVLLYSTTALFKGRLTHKHRKEETIVKPWHHSAVAMKKGRDIVGRALQKVSSICSMDWWNAMAIIEQRGHCDVFWHPYYTLMQHFAQNNLQIKLFADSF